MLLDLLLRPHRRNHDQKLIDPGGCVGGSIELLWRRFPHDGDDDLSDQSARMMFRFAVVLATRSSNEAPTARNSFSSQPIPTPKSKRPLES